MAFKELEARSLPRLACIGRVQKIGEPKFTKKNDFGINYVMIPIEIEGYGASRSTKANFMFRPEWFGENFDPKSLGEVEGSKGLLAVYGNNISQRGRTSLLQGLTGGNEEAFGELADKLISLGADASETDVAEVLHNFLIDEGNGQLVGYVLRQQSEKTDDLDDNGKPIYVKTQYYEIGDFFAPNERGREKIYKSAARAAEGTYKVQFTEEDVPF